MIKFVSDLRQVGGFIWVLRFPQPIKLTAMHDIAEIFSVKVTLNIISLTRGKCLLSWLRQVFMKRFYAKDNFISFEKKDVMELSFCQKRDILFFFF